MNRFDAAEFARVNVDRAIPKVKAAIAASKHHSALLHLSGNLSAPFMAG